MSRFWERETKEAPNRMSPLSVDSSRVVKFAGAFANSSTTGSDPANVLNEKADAKKGWAPASAEGGAVTLVAEKSLVPETGSKLLVSIERSSAHEEKVSFRLALANDRTLPRYARVPSSLLGLLGSDPGARSEDETKS
jgi:hypothetical protein